MSQGTDPFEGHPQVNTAEKALRDFGATDREAASRALSIWQHTSELSDREREAVLDRFGPAPSPARYEALDVAESLRHHIRAFASDLNLIPICTNGWPEWPTGADIEAASEVNKDGRWPDFFINTTDGRRFLIRVMERNA